MRYDNVILGVIGVGVVTALYFTLKPGMDRAEDTNRMIREHASFSVVTDLASTLDTISYSPIDYTLLTKGEVEGHSLVAIRKRCDEVQKLHQRIGEKNLPAYQDLLKQAITTCANIGSKVKDSQLTFAHVSDASTFLRESASSAYTSANSERRKRIEAERTAELKNAKTTAAEMSNWNKEQ